MSDILYLGSCSQIRQKLLKDAGLRYEVLEHKSSEDLKKGDLSFHDYVRELACHKMEHIYMEHVVLTKENSSKEMFVCTADTLMMTTKSKTILGKPKDKDDAKRMLRMEREEPIDVTTGCCVEHKIFENEKWITKQKKSFAVSTIIEFCVPEEKLDFYFDNAPFALSACGAGIIEGAGALFLKRIEGSYSSVLGLPLFELLEVLDDMGFVF
jgi:septum formation protein